MEKPAKYVIFQTEWGYFGLLGADKGLLRTCLPTPRYKQTQGYLLQNAPLAQLDPSFSQDLQHRIAAYFRSPQNDSFQQISVDFCGLTAFQKEVLIACRSIVPGQTATYGRLAKAIGKPKACRAVGNALARNPLPLIIPCHRILGANNRLCGFSAQGGIKLKEKMLRHEQNCGR